MQRLLEEALPQFDSHANLEIPRCLRSDLDAARLRENSAATTDQEPPTSTWTQCRATDFGDRGDGRFSSIASPRRRFPNALQEYELGIAGKARINRALEMPKWNC